MGSVRDVVLANLPEGYEEIMDFGMISYVVPLSVVPKTYNGHPLMYASLADQKNHMALYLMCLYTHNEDMGWFEERYAASGKKLDMGKSCVRFKKLDDLPLDLIGEVIGMTPMERYVSFYEEARANYTPRKREKKAAAK
ncbi:MAG: DUF1801 domain-containing protein [Chloroflexota bacterium]|nr:DUF1801 domain-containing protein [Chloroflexota bacterium]